MDAVTTSTAAAAGLMSALSTPEIAQSLHSLLVNALQLAALGLSAATAYGIRLWINSLKYSWQRALAAKFVGFAQQRIATNPEKLAYVKSKLKQALPSLTDDDVDHLVEDAVCNLKAALGRVQKPTPPTP